MARVTLNRSLDFPLLGIYYNELLKFSFYTCNWKIISKPRIKKHQLPLNNLVIEKEIAIEVTD